MRNAPVDLGLPGGRGHEVLTRLGFRPRAPVPAGDLARAERRREWIEDTGMERLRAQHLVVPIAGAADLIEMKQAAGPEQDVADADALRRLVQASTAAQGQPVEGWHPKAIYPLRRAGVVSFRVSGGGGYGDPRGRDPEHVARDVRLGHVSAGKALEWYGVVVDPATAAVDVEATGAARRKEPER